MPIEVHCHNDLGLVGKPIPLPALKLRLMPDAMPFINTCVNGMGASAPETRDLVSVILAIKYGSGHAGVSFG